MGEHSLQFAALVGSRICHDLISPIGAINNGMELISMTGGATSPEMSLISESVDAANARIRFFRIAYGGQSDTQRLGHSEIMSILRDLSRGSRLHIQWTPTEELSRSEVQIAFLAIQCAEQAMPFGGSLTIARRGETWQLDMDSERMLIDEELWASLKEPVDETTDDIAPVLPAHVQFLLLPMHASDKGRQILFERTETGATLIV
ncbi:histidine phosphotransferase family protein [Planktotalea sp.]|uniref:histidine phosphotransferase family protein n=1 Tax=Planktotalea sp. TaxID=2029877 RepID=UPI00329841F5